MPPISEQELKKKRDYAVSMVTDFAQSTNSGSRFIAPDGEVLFSCNCTTGCCDRDHTNKACMQCHDKAILESDRFGGRYIYTCPAGYVFFCSPINTPEGYYGVICGPYRISELDVFRKASGEGICLNTSHSLLDELPLTSAERISRMSELLFVVASHLGDLVEHPDQQSAIAGSPEESEGQRRAKHVPIPYPLGIEQSLVSAIRDSNRMLVNSLIAELLSHPFFNSDTVDMETMRIRATELITVLCRVAIECGAEPNDSLLNNEKHLREIICYGKAADINQLLSEVLNDYVDLVFSIEHVWHVGVIQRSVAYIQRNYMHRITLEQIAEYVYLSPCYFSKIFKSEMKLGFSNYLNKYRVDRCKELLLTTSYDLADVCKMTGFEDQSYFSKVFKRFTGTTPAKYRKFRGNISPEPAPRKNS